MCNCMFVCKDIYVCTYVYTMSMFVSASLPVIVHESLGMGYNKYFSPT